MKYISRIVPISSGTCPYENEKLENNCTEPNVIYSNFTKKWRANRVGNLSRQNEITASRHNKLSRVAICARASSVLSVEEILA